MDRTASEYDYSADNPRELLEHVINATICMERKLIAGETIDDMLAAEYLKVQKAFYKKLSLGVNNKEFVSRYKKFVEEIERTMEENNPAAAITLAKRYLNAFLERSGVCLSL